MLLTVQKQVVETMEVKTPAYYKSIYGHYYINDDGVLIAAKKAMVYMWDQTYGKVYTDAIAEILRESQPCERSEFDAAYAETLQRIQAAVDGVEINS